MPWRRKTSATYPRSAWLFGIWMSLEPAVAALVGLVLLSEALAPRKWAAIASVMVACAGAARGAAEPGPAAEGALPPPPS